MKRKISVALETPIVSRWFYDVVTEYGRSREVSISICLMPSRKPEKSKHRLVSLFKGWIAKRFPFFEPVNWLKYLQPESVSQEAMVLGCVSDHSQAFEWDPEMLSRSCFLGPRGDQLVRPGIKGLWYFYLHFFSMASPLFLKTGGKQQPRGVFFQTRNFTMRKNVGFLQFNIEKILDHFVFGIHRPFTSLPSSGKKERYFGGVIKFIVWQLAQKFKENLLNPRWHLLTMNRQSMDTLKAKNVTVLKPPAGQAWADPMLIDADSGLFLFLEEVKDGKGHLAVVELDRESMSMKETPAIVLNKSTHLSYPFVFKVGDDWYMLPENSQANELCIYKAERFPFQWSRFKRIFQDQKWVDFTPFYYQGKWWMFGVKKETSQASSYQDLYLYYCQDILTDTWISHPQNPVVSDVRQARPAGPLFFDEGRLMRPAQNCLNRYGGGLVLCEVTTLSETSYSERVTGAFQFSGKDRVSSFHTMGLYGEWIMGDCFV